jgi:hypothetical protein
LYSEDPVERDYLGELDINAGDYIRIYLKETKEYDIFIFIHKSQFNHFYHEEPYLKAGLLPSLPRGRGSDQGYEPKKSAECNMAEIQTR